MAEIKEKYNCSRCDRLYILPRGYEGDSYIASLVESGFYCEDCLDLLENEIDDTIERWTEEV